MACRWGCLSLLLGVEVEDFLLEVLQAYYDTGRLMHCCLQGSCSSAMSLDVVLPDDQALTPGEEDAVVRVEAPPDTPPLSDPVAAPHVTPSTSWQPPVRAIRILLGHSLGGICASLAALEQAAHRTKGSTVPASGQAVDALVLVAPAVLAMQGGLQSLSEFHERLPSAHLGK